MAYRFLASASVGLAAATLMLVSPAAAVTFNLRNAGGVTAGSAVYNGFAAAASYWASVLSDDVTINLDIGYRPLGTGVLGSASSSLTTISTAAVFAALRADARSALDATSVANLPTLSTAGGVAFMAASAPIRSARTGLYSTSKVRDNNDSANNLTMALTTANARALGFSTTGSVDASITFSSNFAFDFNPNDGIAANNYDFIGVATHEIGHALGFISGVDYYDFYTGKGPRAQTGVDLNGFAVGSPLDLFRYNRSATNNFAYTGTTPPVLDWSAGGTAFLSVDGGYTPLNGGAGAARLSTGRYNGDQRQASHWRDNSYGALSGGCQTPTSSLGLLDPTSGFCEPLAVTSLDLAAFDVIGWNLKAGTNLASGARFTTAQIFNMSISGTNSAAVPEPMTWAMLVIGFGGIGAVLRRQRGPAARIAL